MAAELAAIDRLCEPLSSKVFKLTAAILQIENAFTPLQLLHLLEPKGKLVSLVGQLLDDLLEFPGSLLGVADFLSLELLHRYFAGAAILDHPQLHVVHCLLSGKLPLDGGVATIFGVVELVSQLAEVDVARRNVGLFLEEVEAGVDDGGNLSLVKLVRLKAELLSETVFGSSPDGLVDVAGYASLGQDELVGTGLSDPVFGPHMRVQLATGHHPPADGAHHGPSTRSLGSVED